MAWSKANKSLSELTVALQSVILNTHRLHAAQISSRMINSTKAAAHRFLPKKVLAPTPFQLKQNNKLAEAKATSARILKDAKSKR